MMSDGTVSFDAGQKIIYGLFALVGGLIVVGAAFWAVNTWRFVGGAQTAQGVVTTLEAGSSHPKIKFTAADGREVEYSQNGLTGGWQVGDATKVLYDPQNPRQATVETFGALWGFNLLAFVLGLVFLGAAVFKFLFSR